MAYQTRFLPDRSTDGLTWREAWQYGLLDSVMEAPINVPQQLEYSVVTGRPVTFKLSAGNVVGSVSYTLETTGVAYGEPILDGDEVTFWARSGGAGGVTYFRYTATDERSYSGKSATGTVKVTVDSPPCECSNVSSGYFRCKNAASGCEGTGVTPSVTITGPVPTGPTFISANNNNDENRPEPGENDTFPFPQDNDNTSMSFGDPDIVRLDLTLNKGNTTGGKLTLHIPLGYRVFDSGGSVLATTDGSDADGSHGEITFNNPQDSFIVYVEGLDNATSDSFELGILRLFRWVQRAG